MPNTKPRPPLFVRWLSFEWRQRIALAARDRASEFAEWLCPELKETNEDDDTNG